jgi:hypothetical protein
MRLRADEPEQEATRLPVLRDFNIQAALDAMATWLSGLQRSNGEQRSRLLYEKLTGKL